jgi:uncharacterized membrane protein
MVVGYPDRERAAVVVEALCRLDDAWVAGNYAVAAVHDKKGRLRVLDGPLTRGGTPTWRALWRRLLASPSSGASPDGVRSSRATTAGIPDTFVLPARDLIQGSASALILLIRTRLPAHIVETIGASDERIVRAQLSGAQDALLYSVLDVLGPVESRLESETV